MAEEQGQIKLGLCFQVSLRRGQFFFFFFFWTSLLEQNRVQIALYVCTFLLAGAPLSVG